MTERMQGMIDILKGSPYATGIDISYWQDTFDIDSRDVSEILPVLDFVGVRIGLGYGAGTLAEDSKFREFWCELEEHPTIARVLYWYFGSNGPWEKQRDKVFEILDSLNGDWEMFALDIESSFNVKSAGYALTGIRFMKAVRARYPGKRVVLYSNKWIYNLWLRVFTAEYDNFPYWHAQYVMQNWQYLTEKLVLFWSGLFSKLTKKPDLPASRNGKWEIWQVASATALGRQLGLGSYHVDINISRRKRDDFMGWLGYPFARLDITPVPPVEPLPSVPEDEIYNEALSDAVVSLEELKR